MSKKNALRSGLDALLSNDSENEKDAVGRGRPKTNLRQVSKTSQQGTKENETRATFIVNEKQLEELKAIAHWERVTIKEALIESFSLYLLSKKDSLPKAIEAYSSYKSRTKKEPTE